MKFNFERQWAFIRFVGAHADSASPAGRYNKIDANTI
ncbi:MAG: hypothetical protein Q8S41_07055 [Lutibacter sp.]|nr:hypothetical protein [Lutibacter sp.]